MLPFPVRNEISNDVFPLPGLPIIDLVYQKNYDNTRIDMTVTMKRLLIVIMIVMLAVVIAMVRNNICFLQVEATF